MSRKLTDFGVKASLLVFSINILQFVHLISLVPRLPPHFILKYLSTEHKTGVGTMGGLEFNLRIMGRRMCCVRAANLLEVQSPWIIL